MNWKELRTHAEAHGKLTAVLLCMLLLLALSLTLLGCAAELASRNYLSARIDTVQRLEDEFAVIKARPLNVSERVGLNEENRQELEDLLGTPVFGGSMYEMFVGTSLEGTDDPYPIFLLQNPGIRGKG